MPDENRDTSTDAAPEQIPGAPEGDDGVLAEATEAIERHQLWVARDLLAEHVREVLAGGATAPGHVVNLGHGVPPGTDPQVLTDLVSFVHDQPLEQTPRGGRP